MKLSEKQKSIKSLIEQAAALAVIDPAWACAVAMTESSLGGNQVSHTGARGVFQNTRISMLDLLMKMGDKTNVGDKIGILAGVSFLALLLSRWGSEDEAIRHFCDPKDVMFYLPRVKKLKDEFGKG